MNASTKKAVGVIAEDAWTAVGYPKAVWDEEVRCRIPDAGIAEIE